MSSECFRVGPIGRLEAPLELALEIGGQDVLAHGFAEDTHVGSSFATPIGSPTHMLVYAPGGYRFSDFMRIGLLMNLIILAANIFIVNIVYPIMPLQ